MTRIFQSLVFVVLIGWAVSQITIPLQSTQTRRLSSRMLDTSSSNISLTNELNFQFVGPIEIGTPPQTFQVIFDTYSADLAVFSPACTDCDATFNTYNATASSTYFDEQKQVDFDFYGGANIATCEVYSDFINIAGYNVSDAEFLVIVNSSQSSSKNNEKYDGFFGMGFASNLNYSVTPFAQLMDQQNLSKIFSFYYTNTNGQNGSSITLGGYNTSLTPNITYHNVSSNNTWQLALDDFGYGNQSYSNNATGLQVIIGTGLPSIFGSSQLMDALLDKLPYDGHCNIMDYLPNLYFTIGGIQYQVPPTLFYQHSDDYCYLLTTDDADANTTIPINGTIYLGIPFIQAYYTVFDMENQQIGFAPNPLPAQTPQGAIRLGAASSIVTLLVGIIYMIL